MAQTITVKASLIDDISKEVAAIRRNTEKNFGAMQGSAKGLGASFKAAGVALGGLFALKKIGDIMAIAAGRASDLEEATTKMGVVFRGIEVRAQSMQRELIDAFGQSRRESAEFLSSTQDLLVPMGLTKDAAAAMSFAVAKLSTDLGSFNNLPTAQVMADIQSALVGNFETTKKYGIVLNEARVKQEAMNQGLFNGKGILDAATKAQIAFELITRDSAAAVGDFNRTSEGFANQTKILSARWEDLTATFGQFIIKSKVVNLWISGAIGLMKNFNKELGKTPEQIRNMRIGELQEEIAGLSSKLEDGTKKVEIASTGFGGFSTTVKLSTKEVQNLGFALSKAEKELTGLNNEQKKASDILDAAKASEVLAALKKANEAREKANEAREKAAKKASEEQAKELQQFNAFNAAVLAGEQQVADNEREFAEDKGLRDQQILENNIRMQEQITKSELIESARRVKVSKEEAKAKNEINALLMAQGARAAVGLASINRNASLENFRVFQIAAGLEAGIATKLAAAKALATPPAPNVGAAALAIALGGVQIAAIAAQKPPKFDQGGIVGGSSFTGDNVLIRANSREMVLNQRQQAQLFQAANGGGGGVTINAPLTIGGSAGVTEIEDGYEQHLENIKNVIQDLQFQGQL